MKSLNQRRLEACQNVVVQDHHMMAKMAIKETLVGVYEGKDHEGKDYKEIIEVPVEGEFNLRVFFGRPIDTVWVDSGWDDGFMKKFGSYGDGKSGLWEEIGTDSDDLLADLMVTGALEAAQSDIGSPAITPYLASGREKDFLESVIAKTLDGYAVSASGYLLRRAPFPYYEIEIQGKTKLLKKTVDFDPSWNIRARVTGNNSIRQDLSMLMVFSPAEKAQLHQVIDNLTEKERYTTRRGTNAEIIAKIDPPGGKQPFFRGLELLYNCVTTLPINDELKNAASRALQNRYEITGEDFSSIIDTLEALQEVAENNPALEKVIEEKGWKLTVSPFEVALLRVKATMDLKLDEVSAPRM